MIYTLTLNPALDYDIYTDSFYLGKLNLSKKNNYRVGGKGINVSIMLKNLGVENIALGYIGGFVGNYILEECNKKGLQTKFITIKDNNRINIKLNSNSEETEISGISPNISLENLEKLKLEIKKMTEKDILVLSGSINTSLSNDLYKEISKLTKAKIILDTRGNLLLDNIYNNLLIKPNIKELEEVFNEKIENEEQIYKLCEVFFEKGVENVMLSMGKDGAYLITKNEMYKGTVPDGKLINSIGAGDSTVAGFIYSYLNNESLENTLKMAIACGSATAYSYEIGEKEEVLKLLNDIKIEKIR